MSEYLSLFARTLAIGVAVAAPVGAMGVLCIQRTLASGWRAGMATGLGIATADGIYAGIAAFGVAAVSSAFVSWQTPLRVVGGIGLIWLGVSSMLAARSCDAAEAPRRFEAGHSRYFSAVALTLTNPMTIMAFGAVFASAGLSVGPSIPAAVTATAGVAAGSLSWWTLLTAGVASVRHGLGDRLLVWVSRGSGAIVAAFGIIALVSVL